MNSGIDTGLIIKIAVTVSAGIVAIASTLLFRMKEDNILEEAGEEMVKQNSGLDIDFTKHSPELGINNKPSKKVKNEK